MKDPVLPLFKATSGEDAVGLTIASNGDGLARGIERPTKPAPGGECSEIYPNAGVPRFVSFVGLHDS